MYNVFRLDISASLRACLGLHLGTTAKLKAKRTFYYSQKQQELLHLPNHKARAAKSIKPYLNISQNDAFSSSLPSSALSICFFSSSTSSFQSSPNGLPFTLLVWDLPIFFLNKFEFYLSSLCHPPDYRLRLFPPADGEQPPTVEVEIDQIFPKLLLELASFVLTLATPA